MITKKKKKKAYISIWLESLICFAVLHLLPKKKTYDGVAIEIQRKVTRVILDQYAENNGK